jgi:hypothetical protein
MRCPIGAVMHCPKRILPPRSCTVASASCPKIMAGGTQLVGGARRSQVPSKTARRNPSRRFRKSWAFWPCIFLQRSQCEILSTRRHHERNRRLPMRVRRCDVAHACPWVFRASDGHLAWQLSSFSSCKFSTTQGRRSYHNVREIVHFCNFVSFMCQDRELICPDRTACRSARTRACGAIHRRSYLGIAASLATRGQTIQLGA